MLLCFNRDDSRLKKSPLAHFWRYHFADEVPAQEYEVHKKKNETLGIPNTEWWFGKMARSHSIDDPVGCEV